MVPPATAATLLLDVIEAAFEMIVLLLSNEVLEFGIVLKDEVELTTELSAGVVDAITTAVLEEADVLVEDEELVSGLDWEREEEEVEIATVAVEGDKGLLEIERLDNTELEGRVGELLAI